MTEDCTAAFSVWCAGHRADVLPCWPPSTDGADHHRSVLIFGSAACKTASRPVFTSYLIFFEQTTASMPELDTEMHSAWSVILVSGPSQRVPICIGLLPQTEVVSAESFLLPKLVCVTAGAHFTGVPCFLLSPLATGRRAIVDQGGH